MLLRFLTCCVYAVWTLLLCFSCVNSCYGVSSEYFANITSKDFKCFLSKPPLEIPKHDFAVVNMT